MKQPSDIELEKLIKDSVREMVESAAPPPLEESWARFEKKLKDKQPNLVKHHIIKNKNPLPLRLAIAAGIIVLLAGTLSISFPTKARALGVKIVNIVGTLISGTQINVRTEYKHNEPGQPTPPGEGVREVEIGQETVVSIDEARSACPYPLVIPEYLPPGFVLDTVKFQEMVKPVVKVTMRFTGPDSSCFLFTQVNSPGEYAQGYGYDLEDATVQDFIAGENNGKLVTFKNNKIKFMWIKQGVIYSLEGNLPKEDTLKIIQSM